MAATDELIAGRYRVKRRLGAGGMGEVFDATDEQTGEPVAIKRIFPHFAAEPDLVERFEREARAVARLAHPHVVALRDFQRPPGEPAVIVMERLEGRTLRALLLEDGPLPVGRAVKIAMQVLDALDATHDAGIVHRDIKPDNVFVERAPKGGDRVKLLDFGVAKAVEDRREASLTETGALVGTLAFMAPEQARGEEVDRRADLYGVGAVLYNAICGRKPHEEKGSAALLRAVLDDPIVPLATRDEGVPVELSRVVDQALAPDAEARFASAEEMISALAPFVDLTYTAEPPLAATSADEATAPRRKRSKARAVVDREQIEAAKAMLVAETTAPRASTSLKDRRSLLLGVSGVAACALIYVFAIRDRPRLDPDLAATSATSAPASTTPTPVDTQTAQLKRRLTSALRTKDAAACIEAYRSLEGLDPGEAAGVRTLGAACTMLGGDCAEGRALFRAAVADRAQAKAADTIELQGERMAAANCPREQLNAPELALALKQELANATDAATRVAGALALARAVSPLAPDAHFRAECLDMLRETIVELAAANRCDDARSIAKEAVDLETPRMKPARDALAACR